jgi:hypothetical protein
VGELVAALAEVHAQPAQPVLIQARVPRLDVPPLLTTLARAAATANAAR